MEFVDNFSGEKQSTLVYGKHISEYGKYIILEVILKYLEVARPGDEKLREAMRDATSKTVEEAWDSLLSILDLKTPEGVVTYCFSIYQPSREDLLYRCLYTLCKIKPTASAESWLDNFRINGICNGMNMLVWQDHDKEKTYGVRRDPKPINTSMKLSNPNRIKKFLVGSLREFIIENDLYQTNDEYKLKIPNGKMDDQTICDLCYKTYPFYWGGSHGCNFYLYEEWSINLNELKEFTARYPSAIVGFVLNKSPYGASDGGSHWVSMTFKDRTAYLIDSGGKQTDFADGGALRRALGDNGFAFQYNPVLVQQDRFSCGMFSSLSTYIMVCKDCDIRETVKHIGNNGDSIVQGKNIYSFIQIISHPN